MVTSPKLIVSPRSRVYSLKSKSRDECMITCCIQLNRSMTR